MKVLLVEDEVAHCERYKKCVEYLPYKVDLKVSHGLKNALKLIQENTFEVILLDIELNESDGDGFEFLKQLKAMKLKAVPFIFVITNNRSLTIHDTVRSLGADYIIMKSKPDYSPRTVFDFANNFILHQPKEDWNKSGLDGIIAKEVEKIGFTYDSTGTDYIVTAVAAVIHAGKKSQSLSKDIYPVIAQKYKKTDWSISKAIRNAIIKTWRITDVETLQQNYTSNIDYDTGIPTNKQMILYLADKIKREYAGYI